MQFRSIARRKLAAFASGAVVAGALTAPVLIAAPAQAATFDDVAFSCTTGFGPAAYTTDVALTAQWDKTTGRAQITAELDNFPNGAPPQVSVPNQAQSATLKLVVNGAATATSLTGSTTANFQGGTPIDVPTLTGLASAKGESLSIAIQDFSLLAGASTFACTPVTVPAAVTVPITFPTGSDLNYLCSFGANKFAYLTDATVSAVDNGSALRVNVALENMPNTAPAAIVMPNAAHVATLAMSVNGSSSVNAVGNSVANFQGGTAVVVPTVSADVTTTATSAAVTANSFKLVVGGSTEIPCTLAAPVVLPAVTATTPPVTGPSAACVKAQGDVKTTAAAVKKADTKVKSTKKAVKKATKAAKKAKGKKAKKAKAKLKKAKKAASSAAKSAKSAKSKHSAATNAVKANC